MAHAHDATLASNARDPTRTSTLRKQYARELRRPFRHLATAIRRGIVENDIFGIHDTQGQRTYLHRNQPTPPPRFRFTSDAAKTDAFMDWLREQERRHLLTTIDRNSNPYVERAYDRGVDHADRGLRTTVSGSGAGVTVSEVAGGRMPIHRDRLQALYTRNFEELRGITAEMDRQIARELTEGFAQGEGTRPIARRITGRVQNVGQHRATVMARTEVINAHAEGTLTRYEEAGVESVQVKAELITAGDTRVCPDCAALEGATYTLREARGLVPVHPMCRCAWVPDTSETS